MFNHVAGYSSLSVKVRISVLVMFAALLYFLAEWIGLATAHPQYRYNYSPVFLPLVTALPFAAAIIRLLFFTDRPKLFAARAGAICLASIVLLVVMTIAALAVIVLAALAMKLPVTVLAIAGPISAIAMWRANLGRRCVGLLKDLSGRLDRHIQPNMTRQITGRGAWVAIAFSVSWAFVWLHQMYYGLAVAQDDYYNSFRNSLFDAQMSLVVSTSAMFALGLGCIFAITAEILPPNETE